MNRNTATGQLYTPLLRGQTYTVLVTGPGLARTSCTEVALLRLADGEHTVIYLDETGNVIFDDPTYTYCEDTARDVFRYRTQREFEEWQQRQRPPAEPSP